MTGIATRSQRASAARAPLLMGVFHNAIIALAKSVYIDRLDGPCGQTLSRMPWRGFVTPGCGRGGCVCIPSLSGI